MNFEDFHRGGLIKVTLFYINCLKKLFIHFSFYLLTFLSWTFRDSVPLPFAHFSPKILFFPQYAACPLLSADQPAALFITCNPITVNSLHTVPDKDFLIFSVLDLPQSRLTAFFECRILRIF